MIIILSGQYVAQDLRAEFGDIPPAFLPVGNKRLFAYQINNLRKESHQEKIVLTLPKSFNINRWDQKVLDDVDVQIVYVDEAFSLGQAIAFSLASKHTSDNENVIIYYGDTLLRSSLCISQDKKDVIFTAHAAHNYSWLRMDDDLDGESTVFCGVLSISDPQLLIRSLISSNFELKGSLYKYNETNRFVQELRSDWLDFGHVNTFYDSKTVVTTERAFNELSINKFYVEKSSKKKTKLQAEANWFSHVPEEMAHYTPMLISHGEKSDEYKYKLEYLYSPTLTELFVFGNHPEIVWNQIVNSCFEFVRSAHALQSSDIDDSFYESLVSKNESRLDEFLVSNPRFAGKILDNNGEEYNLCEILNAAHDKINPKSTISFIHGDFCFSNILFDFKKNIIKVIDPRGIDFDGNLSVNGDIRYDLAKFLHSAIGKYDYIVSDQFSIDDDGSTLSLIIPESSIDLTGMIKKQIEKSGFNFNEILAITTTLFLSMLPLHYDRPDRQAAFVATAINLYKEFIK